MSKSLKCEALHGDISQAQRERTLAGFRNNYFNVLVATDVASRGLDIPNVDLVSSVCEAFYLKECVIISYSIHCLLIDDLGSRKPYFLHDGSSPVITFLFLIYLRYLSTLYWHGVYEGVGGAIKKIKNTPIFGILF